MILAEIQPSPDDLAALSVWLAPLCLPGVLMLMRMLAGIRRDGVKTRPDLLELTDVLVATVIMIVYLAAIFGRLGGQPAGNGELPRLVPGQLVATMTSLLVFPAAVVLMMIARNLSPVDAFGLAKVRWHRALGLGLVLGLLSVPLTMGVKVLTLHLSGSTEAPQQLVQSFSAAVKGREWETVTLVALSAVVVAPLHEELIFRGYFYPVLGRWFARVPAAVFTAVFFAAMHDTLTDIPGLTVLALCFTIAYERTGSLLVPFFGHAVFNAVSLATLWAQSWNGAAP